MGEGWIETKLEEVFEIVTGNTPSKKNNSNYGNDIPFIKPPELNNYPIVKESEFLSKKGALKGRVLPIGSVLITCIGNLGRVGINNYPVAFNQQINALKPNLFIESKFTFYQAQQSSFKNQLESLSTSTTVALVNKTNFSTIKFAIAPLPEQRAIVAKIEQLFSELDNGISNLKTSQEQLKVYRQAVLTKAFEGDILTNVSISMSKVSLGDYIEKPKYGTAKKCMSEPIGSPVLRIPNIGNGFVINDNLKFAEFEQKELYGLALKEGDILTIRSNGSVDLVGKSALITKNDIKYLYAGYLIRLRPIKKKLSPKYLLYCLQSQELRVQIESKAKSTSGVNNINSGELESLIISICELEEQHQIVQQIESRLSVCDKVEETIVENLQKAEALRQSILKRAFAGELLNEAEIAACKKEKDWEPAGELLKRIKKDKTKI